MPTLLRPRDTDALRAELRRLVTESEPAAGLRRRGCTVTPCCSASSSAPGPAPCVGSRCDRARASAGPPWWPADRSRCADYRRASGITHDYDGPVLSEGIRSILAVPVVVDGRAAGRPLRRLPATAPIGDRTAAAMVAPRADSATNWQSATRWTAGCGCARRIWPAFRRQHRPGRADPRGACRTAPPRCRRAVTVAGQASSTWRTCWPIDGPTVSTPLTARELDVLAQVALGCTNAEAAERLSLKPETVKSYLRSAAAKLGTRSRHEAVSKARRSRLIP